MASPSIKRCGIVAVDAKILRGATVPHCIPATRVLDRQHKQKHGGFLFISALRCCRGVASGHFHVLIFLVAAQQSLIRITGKKDGELDLVHRVEEALVGRRGPAGPNRSREDAVLA